MTRTKNGSMTRFFILGNDPAHFLRVGLGDSRSPKCPNMALSGSEAASQTGFYIEDTSYQQDPSYKWVIATQNHSWRIPSQMPRGHGASLLGA